MNLPPLGQVNESNEGEVLTCLTGLAQEATDERCLYEQFVNSNLNMYVYGQEGVPADGRIVVNEIQNAIIAATDIQTKDPPQVSLEPVETGEPPLYYWAGPQELGIALGLQPFEVADWLDEAGQLHPPTPIDSLVAGQLKALTVPEELSPALPPGMIRPEWLVELNDTLVAETYQMIHDVIWERSEVDLWVRDNLIATNVQGWANGLYEFDDQAKKHVLRHVPVTQVYLDPTSTGVRDSAYCGLDLPLDADEAKESYPDLAVVIDAEARTGEPQVSDRTTQFGQVYQRTFQRPIIVLRVFWLRNQPVPMAKDEAVQAGVLEERAVPAAFGATHGDPSGGGDPAQERMLAGGEDDAAAGGAMAAGVDGLVGAQGAPAGDLAGNVDGAAAPATLAVACFFPGTGQQVMPGDPAWPTRRGIRQITVIANRVVDDRECEFAEPPLLHNVNIPIPGQHPYGLGEPFRLKSLQSAESTLLDSMVEHARYFSSPVTTMSESMAISLGERAKDLHTQPGQTFIVSDEQWMASGGKPLIIQDPPALGAALTELFPTIKGLLQEQSGHAEVLQGRASPQVKSGKAIELLQTSASSMIGFKSQRTGDMIKRMADLMLRSIVWRLSVADVNRIVSKYPRHVLEVIHERAREIEWNVRVSVHAGNGGLKLQKRQLAQMDLAANAISMQTYQEDAGRDPRLESQRKLAEFQKQARLAAAMGPQPATPGDREEPGRQAS